MAARREHGAPSALTVLEVAEGLRWTDPALGASLAEHARRLAGDDPTVRAAADRSVIRSLEESDRHVDVVTRGVPLLAEARERGDRDDGAAVLVELAAAATGLGDPGLARRLLDRLGPVGEVPARIGAVACAARAESCAAEGDVAGTEAAGDAASPMLFRVLPPDAAVVRARIAVARGVARRRAGDLAGALAAFGPAVSANPSDDVDGGRRSLLAAAEETELLVEAGRHDEARARTSHVLPEGAPGAHVAAPIARIRLALASTSGHGTTTATEVAEELEAAGRTAEAAHAWEQVAGVAEAEGELGQALAALRRGHGLSTRSRDTADRALRTLASVAEGPDPVVAASPSDPGRPVADSGAGPTRRRERHDEGPTAGAVPTGPAPEPARWSTGPGGIDAVDAPSGASALDAADVPIDSGWTSSGAPPRGEVGVGGPEPAPRSSVRDEVAELLASLTRSVDSSRAAASGLDLEPARDTPREPEPASPTTAEGPGTERRSRHSAFPASPSSAASDVSASRPTFDAFSTAPIQRVTDDGTSPAASPVAPLPDDRFAPVGAGEDAQRAEPPRSDAEALSVSDLVDPLADPLGMPVSTGSRAGEREPAGASAGGTDLGRTAGAESVTASSRPADADERNGRASIASAPSTTRGTTGRTDQDHEVAGRPVSDGAYAEPPSAAPTTRRGDPGAPDPAASGSVERRRADSRGSGNGSATGAEGRDRGRTEDRGGRRPEERTAPSSSPQPGDDETGLLAPRTGSSGRQVTSDRQTATASGRRPSARPVSEYEEELALTLASVLGEYHLPDVSVPSSGARDRGSRRPADPPTGTPTPGDVAVPSARRHTSGSMPVPGDPRRTPRPEANGLSAGSEPADGRRATSPNGRGRPPESGARLADLLAEAMDAFRHVGPEAQDGAREPGVGSRRA